MAIDAIPIPQFPNVPIAPGIPPMARPTQAINAVLNGPTGLNATLANAAAVQSIIGSLTNAGSLLANVPGAQQLLSLPPAAQILLYRVPGFSTLMRDAQAAQALFQTAQGLGQLLAQVLPVQRLIAGPSTPGTSKKDQPWGIFDQANQPVVEGHVIKFEFLKDWKIAEYPVEAPIITGPVGSFANYNKVEAPFTARLVLAKDGTLDDVNTFLSKLQDAAAKTDLYSVSTPQWVYQNVNISHLDWAQEASHGAYLLHAAVWLQQIREVVSTTPPIAATQQPSGAQPQANGAVQPKLLTFFGGNPPPSTFFFTAPPK